MYKGEGVYFCILTELYFPIFEILHPYESCAQGNNPCGPTHIVPLQFAIDSISREPMKQKKKKKKKMAWPQNYNNAWNLGFADIF